MKHCETCICGKRAPVQSNYDYKTRKYTHPAGTIAWIEHLEIYAHYAVLYGKEQSAERLAERGGFGYDEAVKLIGHDLTTWEPR